MHDRLAAGSEPAACEADRVAQLRECPVVVEGFGRTRLPDCFESGVKTPELLEQAKVGVLARRWLIVIDELLNLSPTISDPQEVAAGNPNRPSDADLRPLEPLPQAPQSRYPPAADPGPVNPEDKGGSVSMRTLRLNPPPMSAHPAPRATRSMRAETAGSAALALGPNQRGKGGGEVEASMPVMAMAHQRTRGRVRGRAWRNLCSDAMTAGTPQPFHCPITICGDDQMIEPLER